MIYRALDSNGDYVLGKNMQGFLSNAKAVAQAVKTRLLLLKGEWWEDTSEGLPLFQNILGQRGTPGKLSAMDLMVKNRIEETTGVISIASFTRKYENRVYSFSCTITTSTSETATVEVSL